MVTLFREPAAGFRRILDPGNCFFLATSIYRQTSHLDEYMNEKVQKEKYQQSQKVHTQQSQLSTRTADHPPPAPDSCQSYQPIIEVRLTKSPLKRMDSSESPRSASHAAVSMKQRYQLSALAKPTGKDQDCQLRSASPEQPNIKDVFSTFGVGKMKESSVCQPGEPAPSIQGIHEKGPKDQITKATSRPPV